jgi:hypothetical protein
MNYIKSLILILLVYFGIIGGLSAQAQYRCPTSIGYATFCPLAGSGFFMTGALPDPMATSAILDFEGAAPNCSGTINLVSLGCNFGDFYGDNTVPYCENPSPSGTVTFNTGMECTYINGALVPCNDLVTECKENLIEFARNFVSAPTDCKLWEGPCATESEIWRTGDVNIGAIVSLNGYKLGVKGGIITEMLQICKAEWCDYVFSDSFNLMSLQEVGEFIEANNHLPNCTPASEVSMNGGFLLADETFRQQEKIEEIFLHLIRLEQRLDRGQIGLTNLSAEKAEEFSTSRPAFIGEEFPNSIDNLLQIECFQVKPAPAGIGGVMVSPNLGPYKVSWSGPSSGNIPFMPCAEGAIQIPNLLAGLYTVTVSNASGNIGTCSFVITQNNTNVCSALSSPACRQAILNVLQEEAFSTPSNCEQWEGEQCTKSGPIYRLGNVGIGTSVGRSGFSLAVKGGIVADKLRVELCESQGWCDYVFFDGYPLLSLSQVASYIKEHNHLPGTVSQQQVLEDGGIEVRSVKLDQQKKIEEAYLHLIALNKRKETLKSAVSQLYTH